MTACDVAEGSSAYGSTGWWDCRTARVVERRTSDYRYAEVQCTAGRYSGDPVQGGWPHPANDLPRPMSSVVEDKVSLFDFGTERPGGAPIPLTRPEQGATL
jgi:hypothetical protein